jgi:hypothetical protein
MQLMRWPWISRSSHEAMMGLLTSQLSDLKQERIVLLDRLALLGLGGTLFNLPSSLDSSLSTEAEEEATDPDADEVAMLKARYRHRPSQLAAAITRKQQRDYNKLKVGPQVKWVASDEPQKAKVNAALDQAEALGRKQPN